MGNMILELRKELSAKLTPIRYEHSLSVSFTAVSLAMRYGYDIQQAEIAGLLHDCAKHYDEAAIIKKCAKQGISLAEDQLQAPSVLHAIYGAWLASAKYGIRDPAVGEAIRWHTTGKPHMAMLDKILYVADYIEPRRYKAPNLPQVRQQAFMDLDEAIYHIMDDTLAYLVQKGCHIDPYTIKAHEYYKNIHQERRKA